MARFQNLLFPEADLPVVNNKPKKHGSPMLQHRGCAYCPRNNVPGIRKVMGEVRGKDIFVWAQSPGPTENVVGTELIGRAGKWWWAELLKVGIGRDDCDIQNCVRCFPADRVDGHWVMRDPTKEEIHCCSIYTEQAISRSTAKVHLVLGRIAADRLFGKKRPKDQRIFWSDKLHGRVFLLDHPAYFVRGAAGFRLEQFRASLKEVRRYLDMPGGEYAYLESQDYRLVKTAAHAEQVGKIIIDSNQSVVVDIEDDVLPDGRRVLLVCGFSIKPGWARIFVVDHPEASLPPEERKGIVAVIKRIIAQCEIVMQHGHYDDTHVQKLLGIPIRYRFDTEYAEYMAFPGARSYKMSEIANRRFPEFSGHKKVVMPEAAPEGLTYDQALQDGQLHFANVPLKKLRLYNGGDCDLTKRIELSTRKHHISLPLLSVYVDGAYTIDRMEENGPLFDYEHASILEQIIPPRVNSLRSRLQLMARDPEFNPNAPEQVAHIIYDLLKLPQVGEKKDTRKETLEILAQMHEFPKLELEYRASAKMESTYLKGFIRSAKKYAGRLRTFWKLTGTITGRMSAGGGGTGKKSKEEGLVNLQNIHGDQQIKNMLISDLDWKQVYNAWRRVQDAHRWINSMLSRRIFLIFDYSQMEIRFLAQSSKDPRLLALLRKGGDIHCQVGHEITGWAIEKIANDSQTRKLVKNLHFGMIYGLQGEGMYQFLLAKGVKTTLARVNELQANYFARFPKVKEYIYHQHSFCERNECVVNLFGFRIPISVTGDHKGGFWKNCAVNYPIQGGAHQMLLMALALLHREMHAYRILNVPQMEIHDALAFGPTLEQLPEAYKAGKQLMQEEVVSLVKRKFVPDWSVPLETDAKIGFRYGVTVKYDGGDVGEAVGRWCQANQISQKALYKELHAVQSLQGSAPSNDNGNS